MPSEAEARVLPTGSGSTFWEGAQEEAGVAKYILVPLPSCPPLSSSHVPRPVW